MHTGRKPSIFASSEFKLVSHNLYYVATSKHSPFEVISQGEFFITLVRFLILTKKNVPDTVTAKITERDQMNQILRRKVAISSSEPSSRCFLNRWRPILIVLIEFPVIKAISLEDKFIRNNTDRFFSFGVISG